MSAATSGDSHVVAHAGGMVRGVDEANNMVRHRMKQYQELPGKAAWLALLEAVELFAVAVHKRAGG